MVEVLQNMGAGTSPLNHQGHNEDKNHKDNSGMQLRFSLDEGVTYYNKEDHRLTVPLSSPQRRLLTMLNLSVCGSSLDDYIDSANYYYSVMVEKDNNFSNVCPTRDVIYSTITWTGEEDPFQTCYKYGSDEKYCWSNSYKHDGSFYQCIPNDVDWHSIDVGEATLCGSPCQDIHQKTPYPQQICGGSRPTGEWNSFHGYSYRTWTGEKDPFQTCYKYGSGGSNKEYCYTNSYEYNDSFYQCIPNGVDWHSIDTMTLRKALMDTKCETPCKDLHPKPHYSTMCPPVNSTDSFNPLKLWNSVVYRTEPFQTCYKYGSENKYCWTNSFNYTMFGIYYLCSPVTEEECGPLCANDGSPPFADPVSLKDGNPVADPNQCGEPCEHMIPPI